MIKLKLNNISKQPDGGIAIQAQIYDDANPEIILGFITHKFNDEPSKTEMKEILKEKLQTWKAKQTSLDNIETKVRQCLVELEEEL